MSYAGECTPVFTRLLDQDANVYHVPATSSLGELTGSDVTTLQDVLLIDHNRFAIKLGDRRPFYVAETVNYPHLIDFAPKHIDLDKLLADAIALDADCALLIDPWSHSFYHWFEQLFRAFLLEQSGFEGKYIIDDDKSFRLEGLEMLGINRSRVIFAGKSSILVRKLWVTSQTRNDHIHQRPQLFRNFRLKMLDSAVKIEGHKKIFLLRGANVANKRGVVNADQVLELSNAYGYTALDFGMLSFAQQVSYAANANSMLGAHGAAFCHVMFMKERRAVVEFFPPTYINFSIVDFLTALNHLYFPLVSASSNDYQHGLDSLVDLAVLRLTLKNIDNIMA